MTKLHSLSTIVTDNHYCLLQRISAVLFNRRLRERTCSTIATAPTLATMSIASLGQLLRQRATKTIPIPIHGFDTLCSPWSTLSRSETQVGVARPAIVLETALWELLAAAEPHLAAHHHDVALAAWERRRACAPVLARWTAPVSLLHPSSSWADRHAALAATLRMSAAANGSPGEADALLTAVSPANDKASTPFRLVVDESMLLAERLLSCSSVTLVLDNVGAEQHVDLQLASYLATTLHKSVTLIVKDKHVFLSDSTVQDVVREEARGEVCLRAVRVIAPPAFSAPTLFTPSSSMNEQLKASLTGQVVIFKGDANARRLHGDRVDPPPDTPDPFSSSVGPLSCLLRADVALIRGIKCNIHPGVDFGGRGGEEVFGGVSGEVQVCLGR